MRRYDAIVIGGGHNGLVCATYLARAGLSVCVLERHTQIGGAAVTEEFYPGFRNSAASYTVGLLAQKVVDELRLVSHGLRIVPRPMANFVPHSAGAGLMLYHDVAATQASIARHSRRDANRYPDFVTQLRSIARLVKSFLLEAPVDPSGGWREYLRIVKRLPRLRHLGAADWAAAWALLTGSAGDWLDSWFSCDLLKGGLGFDSIVGHFSSPYAGGSGYLLLHHALGDLRGLDGAWGHAIGGMGAVSQALAAAARAHGVDIRVNCRAERVGFDAGTYSVLAGTDAYCAPLVAGAIHPQILFRQLLESDRLPEQFEARIAGWRSESATFRANLALDALPEFASAKGQSAVGHLGSGIVIGPSLAYLDEAYQDALVSGTSGHPVVELLIPSTLDSTLAPPGGHVASLFCQHFRFDLPTGKSWDEERSVVLDLVIDTIDALAPNFRRAVVAAQAYSPLDLERRFGLIGGDIFHGRLTLDQLYWARPAWGSAQYRTPLPGLYLCGSGAHPGGGVTGIPGHNAARAMLADLRGGLSRRSR